MAIAGVGSVAASLGEGLAREGRTLLGGDVAFSLIQREAKPEEDRFSPFARRGVGRGDIARHGAQRRRPAGAGRTQGGGWRLSDARRTDARAEDADRRAAGRARRRVRRGGRFRPCWRGSISRSATASPSATRRFQIRSVVSAEPDKLAGGRRLRPALPGQRSRLARDRIAAARQPGALDLPGEAAGQCRRRPRRDSADRAMREARCRKPAGRSAAATTPRRSSSAPSAASPSS